MVRVSGIKRTDSNPFTLALLVIFIQLRVISSTLRLAFSGILFIPPLHRHSHYSSSDPFIDARPTFHPILSLMGPGCLGYRGRVVVHPCMEQPL